MSDRRDLVFEIGCEELPSDSVYAAVEQLSARVPAALDAARLAYDDVRVLATPRRLAVLVTALATGQSDAVERFKGPAAKAAFDASGAATPAAIGFARGKGVAPEDLEVVEDANGSYVYATVASPGRPATEVLPVLLAELVRGIEWAKSQRWGDYTVKFARPVRWLVALHGADLLDVAFGPIRSGRTTCGNRLIAPDALEVPTASEYTSVLDEAAVLLDQNERASRIREGVKDAAASLGGTAVVPEGTLAEVVNLVEFPTVAVGTFDADFLSVPREILVSAMTKHQRYFPVEGPDGTLLNRFVLVHNGKPERTDAIVAGHERVIRARLADAAFFYREDLQRTLESRRADLDSVVFHVKLGSVAEKVDRVVDLSKSIAAAVNASPEESAFAARAAHLCKSDLVSSAVVEFTDLQGVMGRYYALADGEAPEVADAIREHYLPRFSGGALPQSQAGTIVAFADRLDTLCGIFAAGLAPKGSADPFALRRGSIGILQLALGGLDIDLDIAIASALSPFASVVPGLDSESTHGAIKAFVLTRFEGLLRDRGFSSDVIGAVLAAEDGRVRDVLARCEALATARGASADVFEDLSVAYKRAANLSKGATGVVDAALMAEHEAGLFSALELAESRVDELFVASRYEDVLGVFAELRPAVDAFFDNVLVMDEDERLRANRLALLGRFVTLFTRFADFSRLAG